MLWRQRQQRQRRPDQEFGPDPNRMGCCILQRSAYHRIPPRPKPQPIRFLDFPNLIGIASCVHVSETEFGDFNHIMTPYRHLQAFELLSESVFPVVAFLKPLHIEFMEFFLI